MSGKFLLFLSAFLLVSVSRLSGQGIVESAVSDPEVNADDVAVWDINVSNRGAVFYIDYRLKFGELVNSCLIDVCISLDGGLTFSFTPPLDRLSGHVGTVTADGARRIVYNGLEDREMLAGKELVFKVQVVKKAVARRFRYIGFEAGAGSPQSYGAMLGMVKKTGFYVKYRSNFNSGCNHAPIVCNASGMVEGKGYVWTTGKTGQLRTTLTAGLIVRVSSWLYPYFGTGFGKKTYCMETLDGKWAKVSDASCSGISFDAGAMVKMGHFTLSCGVTNTSMSYSDMEVGLGVMF